MLKKAGIIAAAGAASLVAMSPLAFAGEGDTYKANESFNPSKTTGSYNKGQAVEDSEGTAQKNSAGLVNLSNNNLNFSPQTCGTAFNGNSLVQGALGGLMSEAENESGVNSDNGVNCTNAPENGDSADIDTEDGGKHHGGDKGTK
ncbi:hypothetical protein SAMN05216207_1005200 [Pseudonocardia ammonioxydans]|uniref:Small secreted domain n=1 Tax=Pseudonocardia ammonioxydans TaxID=260086 RepID=A0A1I4V6B8_PSUAM|nr:hypothetical protein [Pseudonocardia ammonioxydans]SFM96718.1 hypothetical protein SAMN05216207_1005200 [Pseudonocardia ammonioxydans]